MGTLDRGDAVELDVTQAPDEVVKPLAVEPAMTRFGKTLQGEYETAGIAVGNGKGRRHLATLRVNAADGEGSDADLDDRHDQMDVADLAGIEDQLAGGIVLLHGDLAR